MEEDTHKTVDYYMDLPYTVELEFDGVECTASIKELSPVCQATVDASESVEELWRRLENAQREWIAAQLKLGREVPEPPGASVDPFWKAFWKEHDPEDLDQDDVRSMMYQDGIDRFPLKILVGMWLKELEDAGLAEVGPSLGVAPKAEIGHFDQTAPKIEGDARLVYLGEAKKGAWIRFDGPRTEEGYQEIVVLDKTLRTEAAIVAALTVLEASRLPELKKISSEANDVFGWLREALLEYVRTHPEAKGRSLHQLLEELPTGWFLEQKRGFFGKLDKDLKGLDPRERQKQLPKPWDRWEYAPALWERTLKYAVALLRHRRADFDDKPLEEQLKLVDGVRKRINDFLDSQEALMAALEYSSLESAPKTVQLAQQQVKAAVMSDVEGKKHEEIAKALGIEVPKGREGWEKIPKVARLVGNGRKILDEALEGGWQKRAREMKAEGERYRSLSEEERLIERLAENTGRTVEQARSLYEKSPNLAQMRAMRGPLFRPY